MREFFIRNLVTKKLTQPVPTLSDLVDKQLTCLVLTSSIMIIMMIMMIIMC